MKSFKTIWFCAAVFALWASAFGCKVESSSVSTYKVTYNCASHGSVKASVDGKDFASGGFVEEGKTVDFSATPDEGYKTVWTALTVNKNDENKASLTVTKDETVSVYFVAGETYSINYELDGGTNSADNPSEYNVESEITLKDAQKTGFVFAGWYEKSDFSGNAVTKIEKGTKGSKTFYAKWDAGNGTPYRVEHYKQNISDDGYTLSADDTENKTGTTDGAVSYTAKTYGGFTSAPAKTNINGTDQTSGTIKADGSTVVKLYYNRNVVTLTFKADGGKWQDGTDTDKTITAKYGSTVTAPAAPARTGWTFTGWNTSVPDTMPEQNAVYSANWNANTYTVAFNANGADGTMQSQTFTYGTAQNLNSNTFSKTGYIFAGWNTTADGTGTSYEDKASVLNLAAEQNAVVTLYAKWILITADNVTSIIAGLTAPGPHKIVVTGEITASTISAIKTALRNNSSAKVDLDLSLTTGLTSLPSWAFSGCSSLASVTIPSSVTSIGDYAFLSCSSLTSVTIPSSVTSIASSAFRNCSSLTSVNIPSSVTSIEELAFYGCSSLTSVNIPSSVTSIGYDAFRDCSSLTSIEIPSSVTSIASSAFRNCSSLTSLVVDSSNQKYMSIDNVLYTKDVKTLVAAAGGLTSVTIPSSVTSIGSSAFKSCSSLTSVNIPSSVTSIGYAAFSGCSSLTSVTIPSSVTSIGDDAFYGCSSLTNVTIPSSVTSIGSSAFRNCSSLTSVNIPSSVTSIGSSAFYGCSSLASVTIPSSVTSIRDGAFSGCSSLTSVTIPSSVTSIGDSAFSSCSSLTSLTFEDTSTWYRTTSYIVWQNKSGGTQTDVTAPATNATYFKSTYCNCFWYKAD